MLTPRGNFHRSRLPRLGEIVTVRMRPLQGSRERYRKYIVSAFPLCDGADWRYSIGIHTVFLRALDTGETVRVAGHWCVAEGDV